LGDETHYIATSAELRPSRPRSKKLRRKAFAYAQSWWGGYWKQQKFFGRGWSQPQMEQPQLNNSPGDTLFETFDDWPSLAQQRHQYFLWSAWTQQKRKLFLLWLR